SANAAHAHSHHAPGAARSSQYSTSTAPMASAAPTSRPLIQSHAQEARPWRFIPNRISMRRLPSPKGTPSRAKPPPASTTYAKTLPCSAAARASLAPKTRKAIAAAALTAPSIRLCRSFAPAYRLASSVRPGIACLACSACRSCRSVQPVHARFAALQVRHALLHPRRLGRALEPVVEVLIEAHGPILLVVALPQAMLLAVEDEHPRRLVQPPQGGGELDVLVPRRGADAALGVLVLELAHHARGPADAAVGAGHVRHHGPGLDRAEAVGVGDHVGDLVSAPAMPLDADAMRVNEAHGLHRVNGGQHALHGAFAGRAGVVDDVGLEHDVAVAGVAQRVDAGAGRGRDVVVEVLRKPLVEVHHQRILLVRIEALGRDQQGLELLAVAVDVVNQLRASPAVLGLLGVGVTDLAGRGRGSGDRP